MRVYFVIITSISIRVSNIYRNRNIEITDVCNLWITYAFANLHMSIRASMFVYFFFYLYQYIYGYNNKKRIDKERRIE